MQRSWEMDWWGGGGWEGKVDWGLQGLGANPEPYLNYTNRLSHFDHFAPVWRS